MAEMIKRGLDREERILSFEEVCRSIKAYFDGEWNKADEFLRMEMLEKEKKAIMGYEKEMEEYKEKIGELLDGDVFRGVKVPEWYPSLEEAVFAELYGLAGLAPWVYDTDIKYRESSSAKLIGDRLYCLINGKSVLQPQRIGQDRREQLKRTFLLASPRERMEVGFHEVYLRNGIRITIYSGERTKVGEEIMVFRKYLVKEMTFEEQARLGTIPQEGIRLFELMVKAGFNVVFAGPVRSGKTTFLQTWQSYEDSSLEGLAISTDPETPWHLLMPEAPIMQLVADGKELEEITKSILRGDNDYVILEEMRDGVAYNIALEIMSIGAKRCKATVHTEDVLSLPYKLATKIRRKYGGSLEGLIQQIFSNVDLVFQFCQREENRGRKLLKGIWRYGYSLEEDRVFADELLRYDFKEENWKWKAPEEWKGRGGAQNIYEKEMKEMLENLEKINPIQESPRIYPRYYRKYDENMGADGL